MERFEFLTEMIQKHGFKIGAEVGTGKGKTAVNLLRENPTLHLTQVAYYPDPSYKKGDYTQRAKRTWWKRVRRWRDRITILPFPSRVAVKKVKDETLDFVFIDADHSYKECLWDIRKWSLKVKPGGLICGHDFQNRYPGVKKAVREVFGTKFETVLGDSVWYAWKKGKTI